MGIFIKGQVDIGDWDESWLGKPTTQLPAAQLPGRVTSLAAIALFAATALLACEKQPASWFQPTAVGLVWANMFLAGWLIGGVGRGTLWGPVLAAAATVLSEKALGALTDIGTADGLLIATLLVATGWASAAWDWAAVPLCWQPQSLSGWRKFRCSIWDLAFLNLIAASCCYSVPRLQTPPTLIPAVLAAVVGGLLLSWNACRWVWCDQWSWGRAVLLLLSAVLGIVVVAASSPQGLSIAQLACWWLKGSGTVIVAQGTTVLALLTCWRWDAAYSMRDG